ncbi:alcohol dehydrogenase [Penicillium capsulatum]|uniref:Alcohol dehydrogenase n=1 Tax=Penicillium capsulatum TaxID=69766 RepID=A0A9W9LW86_9EURO|nr:alcohol dehydrogenase [Penicillium capsulatum]
MVRSLGASYICDHKDADVVEQIANIMSPGDFVIDCIASEDTQIQCGEILKRIGGGKLPVTLWPHKDLPPDVNAVFGIGGDPGLVNLDVGDAVWRKYIPEALAVGKFQAKPDHMIIQGWLANVKEGMDCLRECVSAKVVIQFFQE